MKIASKLPRGFKRSKVLPLSQAIKLGAKKSKQITGNFFEEGSENPENLVCALGAGLKGVGLLPFYINQLYGPDYLDGFDLIDYIWPYSKKHVDCPVTKCGEFDDTRYAANLCLNALIAHLNDQHRWSFRKIYNFVKKVEEKFKQKGK